MQPNIKPGKAFKGSVQTKVSTQYRAPSTMKNQYRAYSSDLERLPTRDLDRANDLRDRVLQTISINSAKRFIVALNSCCQWAVKSGLIAENPFLI